MRIRSWLRAVNLDTVNLLDEVIALCESRGASLDAGFTRALLAPKQREVLTRRDLLDHAAAFRAEEQNFSLDHPAAQSIQFPFRAHVSRGKLPQQFSPSAYRPLQVRKRCWLTPPRLT